MNARVGARPHTALSRLGLARALLASGGSLAEAADLAAGAASEFRRLDITTRASEASKVTGDIAARRRNTSLLSAREEEVASLVAHALSNRQIADRLVISERTVETHVRSILAKLNFSTRTEINLGTKHQLSLTQDRRLNAAKGVRRARPELGGRSPEAPAHAQNDHICTASYIQH